MPESRILLRDDDGVAARIVYKFTDDAYHGKVTVDGREATIVKQALRRDHVVYMPEFGGTTSGVHPEVWVWVVQVARGLVLETGGRFDKMETQNGPGEEFFMKPEPIDPRADQ